VGTGLREVVGVCTICMMLERERQKDSLMDLDMRVEEEMQI
jgi:hypothetical protein